MKTSYGRGQRKVTTSFSEAWNWLLIWGILLVILGFIAISAAVTTTMISVVFLGAVIFVGGIIFLVDTFKSWWLRWGEFFISFILAILYLVVGMMLMTNPVSSAISLTLLLGMFYLVIGILRVFHALSRRGVYWGYSFFSGLIAVLLGVLILANWPASSLFIIGLFIGIDLLVIGFTDIMIALSGKTLLS